MNDGLSLYFQNVPFHTSSVCTLTATKSIRVVVEKPSRRAEQLHVEAILVLARVLAAWLE